MATQRGRDFSLYYLYYDWPGESAEAGKRSEAHKDEIARFADRGGGEIPFKPLTYQQVYQSLRDSLRDSLQGNPEHAEYLGYLGDRYFSGKRAPA